ncbi:unnamed protein product [Sphagnum tenellum]
MGGEEAPHNGGAILLKDVQMTPLTLEGLINLTLSDKILNGPMRADRLLGGHVDFDSGNPGLMEDLSRRVSIVKMLPASLGPEEVKDEAMEDVEGLFSVGEAPDVVSLEVRVLGNAGSDDFLADFVGGVEIHPKSR